MLINGGNKAVVGTNVAGSKQEMLLASNRGGCDQGNGGELL